LTAAEEAGLQGHLSWMLAALAVAALFAGLCAVAAIAQWCLPLRRQQARTFASAVDAANSGETRGSVNSSSSEMEIKRRTSDPMQRWLETGWAYDVNPK